RHLLPRPRRPHHGRLEGRESRRVLGSRPLPGQPGAAGGRQRRSLRPARAGLLQAGLPRRPQSPRALRRHRQGPLPGRRPARRPRLPRRRAARDVPPRRPRHQPGDRERQGRLRRRHPRHRDVTVAEPALIARSSAFLSRKLPRRPRLALVLGSGMGDLDLGTPSLEIPYARIPGFPRVRVAGHPGRLSLIGDAAVLRGRVHYYEGRTMDEVVRPLRVLAKLGVKTVVLTNAAGGLNRALRPGDLMLITDHLNLMGANPLRGGAQFIDLTAVYERPAALRGLKRGVYAAVSGPTY